MYGPLVDPILEDKFTVGDLVKYRGVESASLQEGAIAKVRGYTYSDGIRWLDVVWDHGSEGWSGMQDGGFREQDFTLKAPARAKRLADGPIKVRRVRIV
jgi:hypothetical protein